MQNISANYLVIGIAKCQYDGEVGGRRGECAREKETGEGRNKKRSGGTSFKCCGHRGYTLGVSPLTQPSIAKPEYIGSVPFTLPYPGSEVKLRT